MTKPQISLVRRAGSGGLPGGRHLTWTVAEGRRGRRWRSITTSEDGRLVEVLLLEAGLDGRIAKLEMATPAGLLTLHPESATASLHGNVVRRSGIEHVALPWTSSHALLAIASPLTASVAIPILRDRIGVGEGSSFAAVEVGPDLSIRRAIWRAARVGERRWRLLAADGTASVLVELDEHGIPGNLDAPVAWPLELEHTADS